MLIYIEVLEAMINNPNYLSFLKFIMDCLNATHVVMVLDRYMMHIHVYNKVTVFLNNIMIENVDVKMYYITN